MTETTTAERKTTVGNAYLSKLPDGWHYQVVMKGPDDQKIFLSPDGEHGEYAVEVDSTDASPPKLVAETLAEACKLAGKAVKALDKLRTHQREAKAAAEEFLSSLRRPTPRSEDGTLDTPNVTTGPNDVNVESRGGHGRIKPADAEPAGEDVDA